MLITESYVDPNYIMTLINWVYQSFTTRNIGQIKTLPAIHKSVNPQFIKSKYICAMYNLLYSIWYFLLPPAQVNN